VKAVICSDIQFNEWAEFSKILPNGRNSRLEDQINVLREIFSFSTDKGSDIIFHLGDLFETLSEKISKTLFLIVYEEFAKFSAHNIPVVLFVGNHDWVNRAEVLHIIEPFKQIKNVIVVDEPTFEEIDGTGFALMPYTRTDFKQKVDMLADRAKGCKKNYLMVHQGVSGALTGPRDFVLKNDHPLSDFRLDIFQVFGGHYHKFQSLANGRFIIVGSSLQRDFGEREDEKGFLFLDTDKGSSNFIKTHSPRFFKIEIKGEERLRLPSSFSDKDSLWILADRDPSHTDSLIVQSLGDRVRLDIQTAKQTKVRSDLNISMAVEEQIGRYVNLTGKGLDKEKLIKIGIEKYKRSI